MAPPQRARLKCREQLCRQVGRKAAATHHRFERLYVSRWTQTTEQTTLGRNQRCLDLVANPPPQHAPQSPRESARPSSTALRPAQYSPENKVFSGPVKR